MCEYVYLKSVDRNPNRTLFIHVPDVNNPYSPDVTSQAILRIIDLCMEQIFDSEK